MLLAPINTRRSQPAKSPPRRVVVRYADTTPNFLPGWLDAFNLPVFPATHPRLFRAPSPRVSHFTLRTRSNGRSHLVFSLAAVRSDTLAIPALLSASSALLLLIHFLSTRKIVKKLLKVEDDEEELEPAVAQVPRGFVAKLRHHTERYGGVTIFIYRILRLLAVLDLVGLAVTTLVLVEGVHTARSAQLLNWSLVGTYVCVSQNLQITGNPHCLVALCVCLGSRRCIGALKNCECRKHPPRLGPVGHLACLRL